MLRPFSTKSFVIISNQKSLSPIYRSLSRALPVQTTILYRHSSTHSYSRKSKPIAENDSESQTFGRNYVQVDSPLAKANRYTYAMPEDPYVASERVARILEIGTVDDAADYIKALPIYLQSAVVWNQIIGYCAKHGRANYAEQYFSQVREKCRIKTCNYQFLMFTSV
jgi:pentatricopeptide repeat protein